MALDRAQPLRLLSLDGGGIRGLTSLMILKHLMQLVNWENPPKPCEYFDLIGGTSTGGLIAIMLGRLQMTVDECISKYVEVSSAAFQPKRSKVNIIARVKDRLQAEGRYREDQLAAEFKKAAWGFEGDEDAKLLCQDSPCRVFVCSFEKALNTPTLFRTYITNANTNNPVAPNGCSIWEAARATSAAATFFDPMKIGQQSYVDGATGFNNPVELVVEEARAIWPDALSRIQSIVSIGTGIPEPKDFGDDLKGILLTLKAIATETEWTHFRFLKSHKDLGLKGRYFRFNVDKGLIGVELDDHAKVGMIEAATIRYLNSPETQSTALSFAAVTPPRAEFVDLDDKDRILGWLQCSDQLHFYNEAANLRRSGNTGEWFIQRHFNEWGNGAGSLLWLHASAGSGKTVLTSKIIDHIEKGSDLLAYYYFSFQRKENHTIRDFRAALLLQLVKRLSQKTHENNPKLAFMPSSFVRLRNKYYPSNNPKIGDIDKTLVEVITRSPRTFIIIDALDECSDPQIREGILLFAQKLLEDVTTDLYILITSRPESDIEETFTGMPVAKRRVIFDTQMVDNDIRSHLVSVTGDLPYSKWRYELREHAINYIAQRSNGIFRWADLQIQALRGKTRESHVKRTLNNLPKDLSETYKRMLDRIDREGYREEAIAVLRWLSYAREPLSLTQIGELVAFDVQEPSPTSDEYVVNFSPQNKFEDPWEIYGILSGLISVPGSFGSNPGNRVSFSHFSVREYLESDEAPGPFKLCSKDCNRFIYECCLAYIDDYDSSRPEPILQPTHPLLLYACLRLWYHAEELLRSPQISQDKEGIVFTFKESLKARLHEPGYAFILALGHAGVRLPNSSVHSSNYLEYYRSSDLFRGILPCEVFSTCGARLLGFLSHAGIRMPYDALILAVKRRKDNVRLPPNPELTFAATDSALVNIKNIISLEIENAKSASIPRPPSVTPDQVQSDDSTSMRRPVWELLLTSPDIRLNAPNYVRQTPLLVAALSGDEPFFRFLDNLQGVNHDYRDKRGWGLATCAFIGGNRAIIALVLERAGIDLVSVDRYGWSPLDWAVYKGIDAFITSLPHAPDMKRACSVPREKFVSLKEIKKHNYRQGRVMSVDFSHNGLYLAVSLSSCECFVYDVPSMTTAVSLKDHSSRVLSASWSPDDTLIITACMDGSVRVFLAKSADLIKVIVLGGRPTGCAWLPDGRSFILSAFDSKKGLSRYSVAEYPAETEEKIKIDEVDHHFHIENVRGVVASPDGRFIVTLEDEPPGLSVFRADTNALCRKVHGYEIGERIAVDNESRRILVGFANGYHHQLIDIISGTVKDFSVKMDMTRRIKGVFDGPNAPWHLMMETDGCIAIRDCESSQLLGHVAGHSPDETWCVSWHPGSDYCLASGGEDDSVRIWVRDKGPEVWAV